MRVTYRYFSYQADPKLPTTEAVKLNRKTFLRLDKEMGNLPRGSVNEFNRSKTGAYYELDRKKEVLQELIMQQEEVLRQELHMSKTGYFTLAQIQQSRPRKIANLLRKTLKFD